MANPQIENGHTKIANELAEALSKVNLSPYESRVLWAVLRKTYGWNKKVDKIPLSQIVELTGIPKSHVSRAMKSLVSRSIVTSTGNKRIGLNKNHDQWLPVQVTNKANHEPIVTSRGNKNETQKLPAEAPKVTSRGTKKLPAEAPQKHKALSKEKSIVILPEWLSNEKWAAFLEVRKVLKSPMTDNAQQLAFNQLQKWKNEGKDPIAIIDRSILNGWKGFWLTAEDKVANSEPLPEKECEEI